MLFKAVTGDWTSTILQSQSLELVTIVIVINTAIGGYSGEVLMIGSCTVLLQVFEYVCQLPDYTVWNYYDLHVKVESNNYWYKPSTKMKKITWMEKKYTTVKIHNQKQRNALQFEKRCKGSD